MTSRLTTYLPRVYVRFRYRLCLNICVYPLALEAVERFNSTILRAMTAAVGENYDAWESKIPEVQCGINGTVNSTTARQSAAINIVNKAKLMKKNFDKKRLEPIQYNVGDMVLVERTPMIKGLSSGKLVQKFTGPVQYSEWLKLSFALKINALGVRV
ncbi:hypothetical protein NQ318_010047 [Aromia moschata]|uniref:Polyprotein n=1 Tax=Aromia moschata TaxID=1265417 RepID=A0AAV8XYA9_9CUCU|nr:hypothetical protein NQ318_010047 [Aromia moschata]